MYKGRLVLFLRHLCVLFLLKQQLPVIKMASFFLYESKTWEKVHECKIASTQEVVASSISWTGNGMLAFAKGDREVFIAFFKRMLITC